MLETERSRAAVPVGPSDTHTRHRLGHAGELIAADFLGRAGLSILDRNWRDGRRGEPDLVAADLNADHVVFVEVRTRRGKTFGSGLEAITPQKFCQVRRVAGAWLASHPTRLRCRIDLVGVTVPWKPGGSLPSGDPLEWAGVEVAWVKGATL